MLFAWLLASIVGVAIGLRLGLLPSVERVLSPFLDAVNSMPRIALAPVMIIYFGIGFSAKVALAFSIVVFMVISAAVAGVRGADPDILRLSIVTGANRRQILTRVLLPATAPGIFAVLRLGLISALLGVIASELIASRDGLGQIIAASSGRFQMDAVYGILIILMVVASLLNQLMQALERRIVRWLPPGDR